MDYKTLLGEAYTPELETALNGAIGKEFIPKQKFDDVNEEKKTLAKTVLERDTQITELSKVDAESLQTKIAELTTANAKAQTDYEANLAKVKRDSYIDTELIKKGAVNLKAVKALLDTEKIVFEGEEVKGLTEQITALQESEEWAFSAPPTTGIDQGKARESITGVEAEFYKLNPDLKK